MGNFKRTRFFIDSDIQGKYLITMLIPMLIMLGLFVILLFFTLRYGISFSVDTLSTQISEQVNFSLQGVSSPNTEQYRQVLNAIQDQVTSFASNSETRNQLVKALVWVVVPGFLLIIAQLTFLTIFFSHRLAGPVFRIELGCERVSNGDYTERVALRDGDQLVRLATHFNEVVVSSEDLIRSLYKAESKEEKDKILENIKIDLD